MSDKTNREGKEMFGVRTPKTKLKKLQRAVRETPAEKVGKIVEEGMLSFDDIYRPYIYDYLCKKRDYRFKKNEDGSVSHKNAACDAEDIYLFVRTYFLEKMLLRFDFDRPKVGSGGFRNYLKQVVKKALDKYVQFVPERDKFGAIVYTTKIRRHRDGTEMRDKNGEVMYVPKMVAVCRNAQLLADNAKAGQRLTQKGSVVPTAKIPVAPKVYRLAVVAFALEYDKLRKGAKADWRVQMIEAIYGRLEDPGKVMEKLIASGKIKSRNNFDNMRSLFFSAWREQWWRLWSKIATGPKVSVSKTGKPKFLKGEFVWRALVDEEEMWKYVREKERDCAKTVGEKTLAKIKDTWHDIAWRLMNSADGAKQV